MSEDARREMLGAIRAARKRSGVSESDRVAGCAQVPRAYRTVGTLKAAECLSLFIERLQDYDAETQLCERAELPETIQRSLERANRSRILVPLDLPESWLPLSFRFIRDESLSYEEMDGSDGVITACEVAIALTGTIVLREGGLAQGRRALTLIPDYHLCIVEQQQIVETVGAGIRAMEPFARHAITTISGPSATADIEMIRVRGVHGPRRLEVIVVLSQTAANA